MNKHGIWINASKDGLVFGLTLIGVLLLGWAFRLEIDNAAAFSLLSFGVIAANVFTFARKRSNLMGDEGFSFSQSMGYILAMAIFAGFVYGVGQFLMWNFVATDYYNEIMDASFASLDPELVTEQTMTIVRNVAKKPLVFVFSGIFNIMVYSCFIGFIVSVLVKHKPQIEDLDENE